MVLSSPVAAQQPEVELVWSIVASKAKWALIRVDDRPPVHALVAPSIASGTDVEQALSPRPSTPNVASPDVSGARTADEEVSGRLIDKRNEYHAVLASKILGHSGRGLALRDAVACGYIVRGEGEAILSVEVIEADRGCDFKELLGSLQGLCVLAKARPIESELPWHLAVVRKAAGALENFEYGRC